MFGGMVDTQAELKRIQTQIKYGRIEGVEKKLKELLRLHHDAKDEVVILQIYALDFLPDVGQYASAIPHLERLLSLEIPEEIRVRAAEMLETCQAKIKIVPSIVSLESPDLIEYLNVIRGGEIFKFAGHPESLKQYEVIRNLEKAKELAWHQEVSEPYISWNSLRARASGELNAYISENKIDTSPLKSLYVEISEMCEKNLSPTMIDFYDDIYGDLSAILKGKALGIVTPLHEMTWKAYREMLFPCGWKGAYPGGNLCIYLP